MYKFKCFSPWIVLTLTLLFGNYHLFASDIEIDEILQHKEAPSGVVFEIVSGDSDQLRWAIPFIQQEIKRLRQRFPDLPIAVVSHGQEQFSLTKNKQKNFQKVHKGIQSLLKDDDVPVHVCGTYAGWKNIEESDFPDYVDVAAAGPVQINDYRKLGYLLVELQQP